MSTSEELIERARIATERANLAQERHNAWSSISVALKKLLIAYEGHQEVIEMIEGWHLAIMAECAQRRPQLKEIEAHERANAHRALELYENESKV